ncbi:MAG: copper-binding protein, partial [Betaproteobacteria bacterium]|nr:copper-binding protein [Betaproteobacteria bacterium]
LLGLKQPLKDGDRFLLWLTFKNAGEVKVEVYVQTPKTAAQAEEHKH